MCVDMDWKDALSALTGVERPAESVAVESASKTKIDRKKRGGVVYSTNPDYEYEGEETPEAVTLPKKQQKLRLSMERAGRAGKTVTLVRGFVGADSDLHALCKLLKQKCGVGGSAKDGEIVIQGDHRQRLIEILLSEGYTQTR